MSVAQLRASLALWQGRLKVSRAWLRTWRARESFRYWKWHEYRHNTTKEAQAMTPERRQELRAKWWASYEEARGKVWQREAEVKKAEGLIARRREQLGEVGGKPPMVTANELGLTFQYVFGTKGAVTRGAWHYTAGARAANGEALKAQMRSIHAFHKSLGWGGGSYEALVADDGTIGFMNPTNRKSAAVASTNTGMVNICVPGTTGDNITAAGEQSIRWLKENWHTNAVPSAHRLPVPASSFGWKGHKEYAGQSTACPGDMLDDYRRAWHG